MLAIITLFVHILKYPRLATAQSDIALLDIGVGHFGQAHHLTSGHVAFQFPREASVLANRVVKQMAAMNMGEDTEHPEYASANATNELNGLNDPSVSGMFLPYILDRGTLS